MSDKRFFILAHDQARNNARRFITEAPEGWRVTVEPPKRNHEQNAKFHAICGEFARLGIKWAGKRRTTAQWKVLLVSGHSTATNEGSEIVPGIEGEFVNIRESTALMSVKRGSSLIEYSDAALTMYRAAMQEATA